ncbi:XdhC family protein [Flavihumibacter profundi]|jgi:xanthine dehydrogenase accessory factor|uniref:XdhC family protein n=1 Tax=Flavihumibacter profundi TaxID=2716883 RepID=UPI001CC39099|nr:XdhC family protein [Flavihumibacter profundi]MBZ5858332.1 XdhC family protein [Flavihumibacter profundi]
MLDEFLEKSQELRKKQEPFAIAIVVRREAPSSGKTGDKAIVNKFGDIIGWVGGGCVRAIIIKEAEDAMKSGKPRLVRIGNSLHNTHQESVMEYKMTCQSEGTVEVFIEPVLPLPHLVVMGKTAIAKSLVKLAKATGFKVTAVASDAKIDTFEKPDELITRYNLDQVKTGPSTFIVVATQGEQDETALEQALGKDHSYLGFVSSRKKGQTVMDYLRNAGLNENAIAAIKSPAGIDISAKTPEEVAISILAEIIAVKSELPDAEGFTKFDETREEAGKPKFYINPVCGVPVDINNPKHIIEYQGEKVYFCCDGCKTKFELEPEKYMHKAKA